MKHNWSVVTLGSVIKHRKSFIEIDDFRKYKLCRVQTKAQGVVLREEKDGSEIKTKQQQVCRAGELIFAEMDARFGGYGIIPPELDGSIVSSHYFLYEINTEEIDRQFLSYCLSQPWFLSQVEAKGSTNYAAIRPHQVLNYEIPLPPISDQKRLVAKIGVVKNNLNQILKIRSEQSKDIKNLLYSKYSEIIENADRLPMNEVAPIHRRPVKIELDETYQELGTRSFFKGVFEKESFRGSDLTWEKPYWIKSGDLVFSNIKAWEGSVALISQKHDGWVASHRYITCLPNYELIKPEFLLYFFSTPAGMDILSNASPGSADRNRTLNTKKLMLAKVPVPNFELQKEFVELFHKVEALREHHKQTEKELDELMPSLLDKAFKGEL